MVSGVAQVQVLGSQKYAVHAQLDPHALAARQIGINEVEAALRNWNVNTPTGTIIGPHQAFTLQASGQLMNADESKNMIVTYRNGAPVRLGGARERHGRRRGRADRVVVLRTAAAPGDTSQRAITLGIQRQPGTNTIAVADAVKALLPQFRAELPASVHMDVLYDRSDTIRESYRDVQFTMLLTLALVIMVIFVFLRNVWATVIPSLALPFSIIGTFAVMYMLGYSLDNLSMMALILSVGFVVDDAIVMLENIYRHVEMGEDPLTASLVGSREIGFTIVSMTLSLAAVFIPVLFMGGVLGRLFREFSVTICVAILISGVVSVTLTPMLCSRFLKKPHTHGGGVERSAEVTERGVPAAAARLRPDAADRAAPSAGHDGARSSSCSSLTARPVRRRAEGLHPRPGHRPDRGDDRSGAGHVVRQAGRVSGPGRRHHPARSERRRRSSRPSAAARRRRSAARTSGRSSCTSSRAASARSSRTTSSTKLRPQLAQVPGMEVYMQNPPTVRIGGQVSKSLYQFSMQSPDREELYADVAQAARRRCRRVPGLEDLTSDLEVTSPQVNVRDRPRQGGGARRHGEPDRERVLRRVRPALGVDDLRAGQRIQGAARARAAVPGRSDRAVAALLQGDRHRHGGPTTWPRAAANRTIGAPPPGTPAAVGAARHARAGHAGVGPQTVNHYGQLPAVTISFGLAPGASLGDVLDAGAARSRTTRCPRRQRPVPGRGQGVPELARRISPCCSSSRSWSSTSCSASCTRATSTR